MASGRVPFGADNFMGILTQHMYKAPVPIRALMPQPDDVPPGLEAIVLKCLSKRPEDRYQTMAELLVDLEALGAGQVPSAVNELMARSGGFNVPADYFDKGLLPTTLRAAPAVIYRKSPWPWLAGVSGVFAAVGIVFFIFAQSNESDAAAQRRLEAARALPQPTPAPAQLPRPAASVTQVALAVEPLEAHVYRGDTDLGPSPVMLDVAEGQHVDLEVRHPGFRPLSLRVDGSEPRMVVQLERVARPAAYRPPAKTKGSEAPNAAGQKKKGAIGGGEIVNPWAR
jgi:serine/threonine-protein kinase